MTIKHVVTTSDGRYYKLQRDNGQTHTIRLTTFSVLTEQIAAEWLIGGRWLTLVRDAKQHHASDEAFLRNTVIPIVAN